MSHLTSVSFLQYRKETATKIVSITKITRVFFFWRKKNVVWKAAKRFDVKLRDAAAAWHVNEINEFS